MPNPHLSRWTQDAGPRTRGRPELLAVLSGCLLFASFPPLDLGWVAWIALVPLLMAIQHTTLRAALRLGTICGVVAYAGILAWIRVFGLVPWLLLAAYMAIYVGAFAAACRWISAGRSAAVAVWTGPIVWTALEYLRSSGILGFAWALLGTSQHSWLAAIQVARFAGTYGVTFSVALVNAMVVVLLTSRRPLVLVVPLLLVAAAWGWGSQRVRTPETGTIAVAAIQPNVPQRVKFDPQLAGQHLGALQRLVEAAGTQGAELIVFPESALPGDIFGGDGLLTTVGQWARRARATVIVSSLENGVSNIAVAVAPSGMAVSRYDKVRLVAFGETGIRPGTRHDPLWTPVGRVGVAICFESIFPQVTRALTANGAELLAIITNDAWFDGTAGPAQHAAQAALRAVETDRWIVRAANTGISTLIDPRGAVRSVAPVAEEATLSGRVSLRGSTTWFVRWGDLLAQAAVLGAVLLAAPRIRDGLAKDWRSAAFQQAAAAVVLPTIAIWALQRMRAVPWIWAALLLAFVAALSLLRPPRAWGLRWKGLLGSTVGGLAVVAGLWGVLIMTLRAYGVPVSALVLPGGSIVTGAQQLLMASAIEGWLRGIAFTSLMAWRGWPTALVVTTILGVILQSGLRPEAYAWTLLTGVAFGLIRARTGNVAGLVVPHAIGNVLFSVVSIVR